MNINRVIVSFFVLTNIGMLACSKNSDDFFWEIPSNSTSSIINNRIDNIEFKFCLLNEKGISTTQFKQGENFSFHFAMTNYRNDKLFINDFVDSLCEDDFCQIISQEQGTVGFPFSRGICTLTIQYHPFYGKDNKREVTVPWNDQREMWGGEQCWYKSLNQTALPAGEYYTEFSHKFVFYDESTFQRFNIPITFKINFKIN